MNLPAASIRSRSVSLPFRSPADNRPVSGRTPFKTRPFMTCPFTTSPC